jgi:1-acyl-sn-glycerol-3-phosphate acyltransferase
MRRVAFLLLAPVLTSVGFFVAFLLLPFTPRSGRAPHAVARAWARALLRVAGISLEVRHAERFAAGEPRVVVANHASYLDIPAALVAFPGQLRIVARHTLIWMPFIGPYLKLCGHLLIDRNDPRQGVELFAKASARMRRHGLSVLVFPEGTRSADGRLAPLKGGAFHLATSLGVPVQPLAIEGTFRSMPRSVWLPVRGGRVVVTVGEAIDVPAAGGGGAARKRLAAEVRDALLALGVPDGVPGASAAADDRP